MKSRLFPLLSSDSGSGSEIIIATTPQNHFYSENGSPLRKLLLFLPEKRRMDMPIAFKVRLRSNIVGMQS